MQGELVSPVPLSAEGAPGRLSSRAFAVDIGLALLLGAACLLPIGIPSTAPTPLEVAAVVMAVAVRRWQPALALALGWVAALVQIAFVERPSLAEVGMIAVIYAAAAYGRRFEFVAAGVSAAAGGIVGGVYLWQSGAIAEAASFAGEAVGGGHLPQFLAITVLPAAAFLSSWLVGLARRTSLASRTETRLRRAAQADADSARDDARAEHVRSAMARDVHDVVGHSLAVIIAQADSVQYVPDPDAVRAVVATIARTARGSLAEVRAVIGETSDPRVSDPGDLDALLDPVRAAGVPLEHEAIGEPRVLSTETAVVARRILQELLTNALRHGAADRPLVVRFTWRTEDLVLEVDNSVGEPTAEPGSGIEGMRTRLSGVGGDLDTGTVGDRFVARALLPYRSTGRRS